MAVGSVAEERKGASVGRNNLGAAGRIPCGSSRSE